MPVEDANRWNSRYQDQSHDSIECPRSLLIEQMHFLPFSGLALDVAMGLGSNANFLMNHGLRVVGVDISYVALRQAKRKFPNLMAVLADLHNFFIPQYIFDVIVCSLYLQRDLWMPMIKGLRSGGVIFIECLTEDMLEIHPEINPAYLLKPGELEQTIILGESRRYLDILHYYEGWRSKTSSHPRAVASLIARRIT
jgi:SAM-dependent methyltransferase